ncbi:MAG: 3-hydroxyisobutyrate dehydrogenase [Pseudomonadota bacterium]
MAPNPTIAFIGLGNMGLPMAANLVKAGYSLVGFDTQPRQVDFPLADTAANAADTADIVVTMLPNGQIAKAVADSVLPAMAAGSLLIDCSTIDIESAGAIHATAKGASVDCLDAPVSGGAGGATAGTLTFMVGGEEQAFRRAEPLFQIMGSKAVHCGGPAAGQSVKIVNNMLLSTTMAGTGEAFNLGRKLGIDPQKLFDVMSTSSGSCWPVNAYCPVPGVGPESPADRQFEPGFATDLMLKDALLAQQAAHANEVATPMASQAATLFEQMQRSGMGEMDFSAMIKYLANQARPH